ncbi:MAG: tetratricopeptide repeat protein [Verrucomicrobiia bacterium]|jgi:CHAT domain-containing protein/tetratricopeptide (TPR) repeat protein
MNNWLRIAVGLSCLWLLVARLSPPVFADDATEADALQKQTDELFRAGKFQPAIPLQQRVLELREKTVGPEHLLVALSCQNLSVLYMKMCDFAKAKSFRERQLAILEKNLGSEHPSIAEYVGELAMLNTEMGDYGKAESLYQRALEMIEKTSGLEHPHTAHSLLQQGKFYLKTGNYSKAKAILLRALAIYEKTLGPEHVFTVGALFVIAEVHKLNGEYSKAEQFFCRTLAICEKTWGTDHPQTATCLAGLGETYTALGNYVKAEQLLQRALAIREKTLGLEHLDTIRCAETLAALYTAMGDFVKSGPLFEQSVAALTKLLGPSHHDTLTGIHNWANLYTIMGDYGKAESLYRQVLVAREKTLGLEHPDVAASLQDMALICGTTGNYKAAEELQNRALAIVTKNGNSHIIHLVLQGMAYSLSLKGEYAKAEQLYEQVLNFNEKALGPEHPNVASVLRNLADVTLTTGNALKSELLRRRALAIYENNCSPEDPQIAGTLNGLSLSLVVERKLENALESRERAWRILERQREQVFSFVSERQQASFVETLRDRINENISLAARELPNNSAARFFAFTVVLSSKGAILESIAQRQANIVRSGGPELKVRYDQCRTASSVLSNAMMTPAKPGQLASHLAYIAELEKQKEVAEEAFARASAPFAVERQSRRTGVSDVARALPRGSALVEFVKYRPFRFDAKGKERRWGDWNYVALVLRSGEKPDAPDVALVPLGPADKIETAVSYWRKVFDVTLYRSPAVNLPVFEPASKDLTTLVWKPIIPALGDCSKVYISPDGELAFVNFGALQGQKPNRFVIEDFNISYVTTGRDLVRLGAGQGNPPLLVGAPDYGMQSSRKDGFSPLPGTLAEVNIIAPLLKQRGENPELLTGAQAAEATVKAAKHPRILHLATHGFFQPDVAWDWLTTRNGLLGFGGDESDLAGSARLWLQIKKENPMRRSGIALAHANDTLAGRRELGDNDGILTAEEVIGMDLWGTQLVVISACESGLGESRGGEGVFGLRRAFALAGAQNLVMTLWPVADEPTMMEFFYRHLQTEGTPQRALLAAQREWIAKERSGGREPHPFFWAAFVASGTGFGLEEKAK